MFDSCQTQYYTDTMERERTITTRELLRNFRHLKEELLSGKLNILRITVDGKEQLELTSTRPIRTAGDLLTAAKALKRPIRIRPAHVFDGLLRSRPKR